MTTNMITGEAKAIVYDKTSKSLTVQNLPVPIATGPEDHLVRVQAVALTNGELEWPEPLAVTEPIPGYEFAGVVVSAPPHSPFQPGSSVYARTAFERAGSARTFTIATTQELGRKPVNVSWEEAATIPLSALTAWQALFVHGGFAAPDKPETLENTRSMNAGKRVLVTAAAGGVGMWLVQLAHLAGIHVVGSCGPTNAEFVRSLGANDVLDYRVTDLAEWVAAESDARRFDLAVDCVGNSTLRQAWATVRSNGKVISVVEEPDKLKPTIGVEADVSGLFFIVEAHSMQLSTLTALIEAEMCKPAFDSVFEFGMFQDAFAKVYGGHARGKVVLKIC